MTYLLALLVFVGVYAVAKFLLEKVPSVASIADVVAIVVGVLAAMFYAGVLK